MNLEFIYNNIHEFGGFFFVGACILVGAYWIREKQATVAKVATKKEKQSKKTQTTGGKWG